LSLKGRGDLKRYAENAYLKNMDPDDFVRTNMLSNLTEVREEFEKIREVLKIPAQQGHSNAGRLYEGTLSVPISDLNKPDI
jgi:hypothetical protein